MVCDLHKINRLLKPFVIQLPKIDQILNDITAQSPQMLTSIDLYKSYHSIRLSPKTNQLTAFCSPKTGQSFVWQVLPMGLSVSSGAFVYVINKLFQDKQKFPYLFYYIDDILISSSSFTEHLQNLNSTFATLRANSLMVNPSKTCAGYTELGVSGSYYQLKRCAYIGFQDKSDSENNTTKQQKGFRKAFGGYAIFQTPYT